MNKGGIMATASSTVASYGVQARSVPRGGVVLLGRLLFGLLFIMSGPNHFAKQTIGYAAAQGVPLASLAVPLSGLMALVGGLSIILGYRAKFGAWLIVLFLVPVTFMKNIAILGGALLITQLGAGPLSLDSRHSR